MYTLGTSTKGHKSGKSLVGMWWASEGAPFQEPASLICQYLEYKGETGRPLTLGHAADLSDQALGIIHLARQRPQGWRQSAENSNAWHCSQGRHRGSGNGASPPALPPHINILQSMFLPL